MASKNSYGADQIQVLEGLDPVRKRPGMYIGGTGPDGLHHLIWEIVNNCIDEIMAGRASDVTVEMLSDGGVRIADNGAGIPIEKNKTTGKSTLETVLTVLHAGGKFGGPDSGYKVSGGLHGVGSSVVNALSTKLIAEVRRDGKSYIQEYAIGKPLTDVKTVGKSEDTGTTITFWPDASIFETIEFEESKILEYLRRQAYLTKGAKLIFSSQVTGVRYGFYFEGGIRSYVQHLNQNRAVLNDPPFYTSKSIGVNEIEIALQYNDSYVETTKLFANNIPTNGGGTHEAGFRRALTRNIND
jgi:DNA gyrase subunit B